MSENTAICVEHLTKIYKIFEKPVDRLKESLNPFHKRYSKDFYALKDLSFSVERGGTLGIIGKNGAGKSTLLKIITGVLSPSSGTIQVQGRIASLLELGAGFNPEMTGIENIYLNGTVMGYSREDMDKRLADIVAFADIGDFINQPVKMYSSGMFARLAFAVNAYVEPDILIVDEALSVGDIAFQAKCISRMRQMMKSGVTILFVTHDMSVVKSFCKECIYLQNGTVKIQGPAEEVADVYLRNTRDQMNAANMKMGKDGKRNNLKSHFARDRMTEECFVSDPNFEKRVQQFRQGNGKVRIRACRFLDMDGESVVDATFNQQVRLRIYLEFLDRISIGVGFHIRDDRNIEIIGSSTGIESDKEILGDAGDRYVVEFTTHLPLLEGSYNITLVASQKSDEIGTSAVFCDLIENAHIFKVDMRKPAKLWNKVYIPTDYKVSFVEMRRQRVCSCCHQPVDAYLPLPDYYKEQRAKYGVSGESRPEMVNRQAYSCPICGAADRERAYALWFTHEVPTDKPLRILDVAPSKSLQKFILKRYPLADYKTGDLYMDDVDYKLDVMDMHQIEDDSIDVFICSHVLEHVKDDIQAMREFRRILCKDGKGILVVPIDLNQKEFDEDLDCTDIGERWRRFGQDDHVRKYSKKSYVERLKSAGLSVQEYDASCFDKKTMEENELLDTTTIYVVSKG